MTRFSIDLDPELNTWIEECAKQEGRSKAKQVAHTLKLYRDILSAHASGLQRPGYSLSDEQWLSLKGNSNSTDKRDVMTEREREAWDKIRGKE